MFKTEIYRILINTAYREEIREDESGLGISAITDSLALLEQKKKKQNGKIVRLGMMRHLNVIIDLSEAMQEQDLKPTRHVCTMKVTLKKSKPIWCDSCSSSFLFSVDATVR